jgi:hypothetical protein
MRTLSVIAPHIALASQQTSAANSIDRRISKRDMAVALVARNETGTYGAARRNRNFARFTNNSLFRAVSP